jgi:hypothetical protein
MSSYVYLFVYITIFLSFSVLTDNGALTCTSLYISLSITLTSSMFIILFPLSFQSVSVSLCDTISMNVSLPLSLSSTLSIILCLNLSLSLCVLVYLCLSLCLYHYLPILLSFSFSFLTCSGVLMSTPLYVCLFVSISLSL